MKPIILAVALAGAAGAAAQEPMSLEPGNLAMSYATGQYADPTAGISASQYGTYDQAFTDVRAGQSRDMAASLNGLLEARLATELEERSSSQMQRSAES